MVRFMTVLVLASSAFAQSSKNPAEVDLEGELTFYYPCPPHYPYCRGCKPLGSESCAGTLSYCSRPGFDGYRSEKDCVEARKLPLKWTEAMERSSSSYLNNKDNKSLKDQYLDAIKRKSLKHRNLKDLPKFVKHAKNAIGILPPVHVFSDLNKPSDSPSNGTSTSPSDSQSNSTSTSPSNSPSDVPPRKSVRKPSDNTETRVKPRQHKLFYIVAPGPATCAHLIERCLGTVMWCRRPGHDGYKSAAECIAARPPPKTWTIISVPPTKKLPTPVIGTPLKKVPSVVELPLTRMPPVVELPPKKKFPTLAPTPEKELPEKEVPSAVKA